MNLPELFSLCNTRDWDRLRSFLSSDVTNMELKILVTAVFSVHHPEQSKVKSHGITIWDGRLSGELLTNMASMFTGGVDLFDFAQAGLLAKAKNGLDDDLVAKAIVDYVYKNKVQLAPVMNSEKLTEEYKEIIKLIFPELSITKQQREAEYKKQFAQQDKAKIRFFQSKDKARELFSSLLGIEDYEFKLHTSLPSDILGIKTNSMSSESSLSFRENIAAEYIKGFASMLKSLGLSANFFNYPTGGGMNRGIQLWATPQEIEDKLIAFQSFCASGQSDQSNEQFTKAVAQLAVLRELKYKESDVTYEGGF